MAKRKKVAGFFTSDEVVEAIRLQIGTGSQVAFAVKVGISPQLLCDVLAKHRSIPAKILEALGLEEVEQLYRRKGRVGK